MRPIPWNKAFRKRDGSLVNMEDIGGGGGGSIPVASTDVLGGIKVGKSFRMYGETLESVDYISDAYVNPVRPMFKRATSSDTGKYVTGLTERSIDFVRTSVAFNPQFGSTQYDIDDVIPNFNFDYEFYEDVTAGLISDLALVSLYNGTSGASSITLSDDLSNYKGIVIQGCYSGAGTASEYDTTIIYYGVTIGESYWFGVKDRNDSYCGRITFTGERAATISASRTFKIWGIPE